ncbi:hypothetical protein QTQ03_09420 [Micromonospora sp. WMMA1363]|uniref:N,N-dimethylformamidase beta subunit family domain-containing protein n=1 Tax=Micromonospora sp. WMMA1363 TaxID=3053985 RepID=UPI00259CD315|nr:N,N-dimethylformamidase beta subunit family domain-containing protein [Micromonospora sp. WMMA1363]MDM4719784.1 hypothetical protein [Micromonospora sp. WMMA1363]
MARIHRRLALGLLAGGASAAALGAGYVVGRPHADALFEWPRPQEDRQPGDDWWPADGPPAADDERRQIQGYASATSVAPGDPLDFHVSVNPGGRYRISIYRLGWHGGVGARRMLTSPELSGIGQPVPPADPSNGVIACRWPVSWSLRVPSDWTSGLYQAVFTSAGGWRACTPFVVRDDRRAAAICVVLPVTTWQAYNQWPLDQRNGTSLYPGFDGWRACGGGGSAG